MTLRLGDVAPDFEQDSSIGTLKFHEWAGDSWVVLFSHPADFTPVCTTEFMAFAKEKGMVGIKGHRSVGGFRASIYNACPQESVDALVACMQEFEKNHKK